MSCVGHNFQAQKYIVLKNGLCLIYPCCLFLFQARSTHHSTQRNTFTNHHHSLFQSPLQTDSQKSSCSCSCSCSTRNRNYTKWKSLCQCQPRTLQSKFLLNTLDFCAPCIIVSTSKRWSQIPHLPSWNHPQLHPILWFFIIIWTFASLGILQRSFLSTSTSTGSSLLGSLWGIDGSWLT